MKDELPDAKDAEIAFLNRRLQEAQAEIEFYSKLGWEKDAEIEKWRTDWRIHNDHIVSQQDQIERLTDALVYAASMPMAETLRALGVTEGIIESMLQEWLSKAPSHYANTLESALAGTGSLSKPAPGWDMQPVEDGCVRLYGGALNTEERE